MMFQLAVIHENHVFNQNFADLELLDKTTQHVRYSGSSNNEMLRSLIISLEIIGIYVEEIPPENDCFPKK